MTVTESAERPVEASPASGEVMAIRLAAADREVRLPLYAAAGQAALGTDAGPSGFALPAETSVRLTQFGNRPSSKQRQQAYALAFRASGRMIVSAGRDAGDYGPGCFLCLQVYDEAHRFLTQFWIPLAGPETRQEVELPAAAALGCFAVQIAGAGAVADIAVDVAPLAPLGRHDVAHRYVIGSPDDLLALLSDRGLDGESLRQVVSDHPEIVLAAAAHWFLERRYHEIFQLVEAVRPWREWSGLERVWAQLLFFAARALANLNATQSAAAALDELDALGWRELFDARTVQDCLLFRAQLLIRNGRPEDGVAALDAARLNEPTHWHAYFLLANNLDERAGALKEAYYRVAESLLARPHPKVTVGLVEHYLAEGRWPEALAKALGALGASKDGNDIWLAAANVHLQMGDLEGWRRFVGGYFEQFGLSAPRFPADRDGDARFAPVPGPASPAAGAGETVAVIMTAFDAERTLEHAARSVLAQTHGDIILVIVDDHSTDGTLGVATRLAAEDARVRVIETAANCGTYSCKNVALSRVEADYYTFHDSDDWMHPERVARHLEVMRQGAACTTSLWFRMSADGRIVQRHSGGYQHANPASIFVRRDVVETVGYFDTVRTGADTEYVWRIRNRHGQGELVEMRTPLAIGLHHDASLTQSGAAAFDRYRYSPVRLEYWESWVRWHIETIARDPAELRMAFPSDERPFRAPDPITPDGGRGR